MVTILLVIIALISLYGCYCLHGIAKNQVEGTRVICGRLDRVNRNLERKS